MKQVFINFIVTDIEATKRFYEALKFDIDFKLSNENSLCVMINDSVAIMNLQKQFFQDAKKQQGVIITSDIQSMISIRVDSKIEVDQLVKRAISGGGKSVGIIEDFKIRYSRQVKDLSGNIIGFFWMGQV